ncbi:hypothetical protein DdX_14828 [Ditylenchus destructor]|uniref:Ig-like domain-containing protein n=1 Tax=Ditylenchus destructor TaxID=166010 RepID=A0AAD4QVB1_9BILA|nr:hypothetical protein DdX_14828 [Ditylenchus destructor]
MPSLCKKMLCKQNIFYALLFFSLLSIRVRGKLPKFLRYDVECPFLEEEEYAVRLAKGRCPTTTVHSTQTFTQTSEMPTTQPKTKRNSLSIGAKRALLNFVTLGKKRSVKLELSEKLQKIELVEGTFVEMRCPGVNKANMKSVSWFFDGEKIQDTFANWRVQIDSKGRLSLNPIITISDVGQFECFLDNEWKGSVRISVDTVMGSLLKGFINYLIGSGFALIFLIFYLLFAICFPISGVDDDINEGVDLSILGVSLAKRNDEKEAEMKFQEWLLFQTHRKENKTPIPTFTKEHNVNEEEEVSAIE